MYALDRYLYGRQYSDHNARFAAELAASLKKFALCCAVTINLLLSFCIGFGRFRTVNKVCLGLKELPLHLLLLLPG